MDPHKKVLYSNFHYDEQLRFITSILAVVQFGTGIGVIDLKWISSSNFLHHYISASVADAIMKFFPDSFSIQQSDFAPVSECVGDMRRLWKFGYAVLRKRYSEVSQSAHRTVITDFCESLTTGREPLVPMSSVIPTIRLIEEIREKAGLPNIEIGKSS